MENKKLDGYTQAIEMRLQIDEAIVDGHNVEILFTHGGTFELMKFDDFVNYLREAIKEGKAKPAIEDDVEEVAPPPRGKKRRNHKEEARKARELELLSGMG